MPERTDLLVATTGNVPAHLTRGRGGTVDVVAVVGEAAPDTGVYVACEEVGLDLRLEPWAARQLAEALSLAATTVEG